MKILNSTILMTAVLSLSAGTASAVPVAIVDSGTDLNHADLRDVKWTNPKDVDDAVDNDDNGYVDDIHGWNFAENNNKLFDKRLVGTFSKDVYRFFEIQGRMLNGSATPEELEWVKTRLKDPAYLVELQTFGNFVHGSHVAGIAAADSPGAQIMPLKLIPTKIPGIARPIERNGMLAQAQAARSDEAKRLLVFKALDFLAGNQAQFFKPIALYLKGQQARVANCSFGTSHAAASGLLTPLLKLVFGREMSEEEVSEFASYFVNSIAKSSAESFIRPAPKTLFVIAAGNDGTNNDELPASPANIKADNTITVAATNGGTTIASFSNYGTKMVEIAAPGVSIRSAIPGGEYLELSGTSQAAPYVANIAGRILDMNPKLTPAEVKQVLMGTVDRKAFLQGKVTSGGMANAERAVMAAKHSLTAPLAEAIQRSTREVRDQDFGHSLAPRPEGYVVPLPSLFN